MLMRTIVALAAVLVLGLGNGLARPTRGSTVTTALMCGVCCHLPRPRPYSAGRLVLHPALNIACMTPYQATRALPCDQPVWVYGSPCEVDLGLGRYRSCE